MPNGTPDTADIAMHEVYKMKNKVKWMEEKISDLEREMAVRVASDLRLAGALRDVIAVIEQR